MLINGWSLRLFGSAAGLAAVASAATVWLVLARPDLTAVAVSQGDFALLAGALAGALRDAWIAIIHSL